MGIYDGDTEFLIRKYLHSGVVINGQRHKTLVGTPQGGGNLSPLLSNIMLNESVSRFIEKRLGLKVNMTKTKIIRPSQLKYLGFGFYKVGSAVHIKPKFKSLSINQRG